MFRLYPTVQESVEAEIFVPYTEAKISEICMVENGENVAFKEVEGGICMTVPAGFRRGSAPIALVFEMKKERQIFNNRKGLYSMTVQPFS